MSVYKKLNAARLTLQNTALNKSGKNSFAKYEYFELGDFLPKINKIFSELELCGVISFTAELATLTITDIEDSTQIVITSPMGSADLKGCHVVQNIGAVETYQRRYLWVTALEIVEHDALEQSIKEDKKPLIALVSKVAISDPVEALFQLCLKAANTGGKDAYGKVWKNADPAIRDILKLKKAKIDDISFACKAWGETMATPA